MSQTTSVPETNPRVDDPPINRNCAFCLVDIPAKEVLRCGKCHRRAYCGKVCQLADWRVPSRYSNEPLGQGHKNWCGLQYGEEDLDWKVVAVEGKGLGIVVLRTLPLHFRLMVDSCQPNGFCHSATHDLMPINGTPVEKFNLNRLGCGKEDNVQEVLCPRISRANHSCSPNASHLYDNGFRVKILFSEREIPEGEEICIAYSSFIDISKHEFKNPDMFRAELNIKWGIICPDECICRDATVAANVQRARDLDERIPNLAAKKEHVGRAIRAVHTLMELHKTIQSSWLSKQRSLYDGLQIAVMTKATLVEGQRFAVQLYELCEPIMHPRMPRLLDFQNWKNDVSSHPNFLAHG